jgi:hypothetical protein
MRAISYSWTLRVRVLVESPAKTTKKPSMASMPMPTPSRNSPPDSYPNTLAGTCPNFRFGEGCGTTRSAALIDLMETDRNVDFNDVILLPKILNFDLSVDGPQFNPGVNLPYQLALPTYAATAWYHHKVAGTPTDLPVF